jgi:pimeloyl-ACP methyl ester carboxylesterase
VSGQIAGATASSKGPSLLDSLTEMPRIMCELGGLTAMWGTLISQAPKGDGHPVLVLPGFSAGDDSTLMLRRFITRLGYKPLPWLQGTNTGNTDQLEALMYRFYRLHRSHDCALTIVGQSLGGVYAREIAKEFPDAVRSVITLGSPYNATGSGSTSPMVERLFEQMSGMSVEEMRARMPENRQVPLSVPATSVYSTNDGVVGWRTCVEPESASSENIRVHGSHSGMAMNADVLRVIADRLAQNPANWTKFDKEVGCRRMIYPKHHARA